jgi:hypothetical protein
MDPKNVAIVFGSVIFGEDEMPKAGDLLSVHTAKVIVRLSLPEDLTHPVAGHIYGGPHHQCTKNIRGPGRSKLTSLAAHACH